MADVFISYSREDAAAVRALAEAVAREGYSVWWDDALPPHLSYSDVIAAEIGKAKATIVVWSEQAIASQWVRAEADLARNQKKLVQTSLDGRMPPMPFNQLHFVSIGGWRGEAGHPGWVRVKESLAALCRGEIAQPVHAFPAAAPPQRAPPPPSGSAAVRLAAVLGGLILVGAVGAGAFWLLGSDGRPVADSPLSPASPGTQPKLSVPIEQPRAAPAKSRPAAAPAPVRVQPDQPQTMRVRQTPRQAINLRRYCNGPGRGTPLCRQQRTRTTQTR